MHKIDTSQLEFIDPKLRKLLFDIEVRYGTQVITSLYRINDTGVHGTLPVRGCDLRARMGKTITNGIVNWVNKYWQYDPKRPGREVAIAHGENENFHIHLQVHPNTIERD